MKLPRWLIDRLKDWGWSTMNDRPPDVIIGGKDDPYMRRWYVVRRNCLFNIYLHDFRRSDEDRALHDHPWMNLSILLHGNYKEVTIKSGGIVQRTIRRQGDFKLRLPSAAHRIELFDDEHGKPKPCMTLFVTGPKVRDWGFHCPLGWRRWQDFVSKDDRHAIGPGCD